MNVPLTPSERLRIFAVLNPLAVFYASMVAGVFLTLLSAMIAAVVWA